MINFFKDKKKKKEKKKRKNLTLLQIDLEQLYLLKELTFL